MSTEIHHQTPKRARPYSKEGIRGSLDRATHYIDLAEEVLKGARVDRDQALAMVMSSDDELLDLLAGAFRLRRAFFGRGVMLHVIRNAKSGHCSEDCAYCSQSAVARTTIESHPLQKAEDIVAAAREAHLRKATRYCIVTAGKKINSAELDVLCEAVRRIRAEFPLSICTSLGELTREKAERLKTAGVNRYNHNLEAAPRVYRTICHTHTFEERLATIRIVKAAGLELCCGGLLGLGESAAERVELAFILRDVQPDAIPINLLDPRPGTPLAEVARIRPNDALRALAVFRFVHPDREIRIAGGREKILGPLQVLSLYAANSLFTEGYLTTGGQGFQADLAMLEAAGFEVAGWTE
jgi:biotin synthase